MSKRRFEFSAQDNFTPQVPFKFRAIQSQEYDSRPDQLAVKLDKIEKKMADLTESLQEIVKVLEKLHQTQELIKSKINNHDNNDYHNQNNSVQMMEIPCFNSPCSYLV